MDFTDKTAIVTGGANGIGAGCCEILARHGARVVVADADADAARLRAEALRAQGYLAQEITVDVSKVSQIRAMVSQVEQMFGGVDILINNAGILHATPIEDITEQEWDRMMDINLKSVFFATQAVLPYMRAQKYGKIVNMASLAGRNGGLANGLGYSATKAGVIGLTRGFASRLAADQINVNAIAPGTTETGILQSFSAERIQRLIEGIPLGRLGKIDEIAQVAVFLCSEEASFMTGAVVDVNGGMYFG